jgi:broad specificity phosphatase PhoE
MTHLLLIRHGETDWNVEGRWQGQADVPLNHRGQQQAIEIARSLCHCDIHAIYSSDLQRALQTAQLLARIKKISIQPDIRLREIHQGEWQGLLIDDIKTKYRHEFQQMRDNPFRAAPPGGESAMQVQQRVLSIMDDIVQEYPSATVAIVSHGFVIAVARTYYMKKSIEEVWDLVPDNGAVIKLELNGCG